MLTEFSRRVILPVVCFVCTATLAANAVGDETTPKPKRGLPAITVPDGFTVELIAGPPLVERPMLAAFDNQGRLYVCDSAGVNLRGPELLKNPPHVIRRLEDVDGDGRFDKSTVFADKMVFPQGIEWHDGAVFCSSPPSFWRLEDTDGDGAADKREELVTGFANTGVADDLHGGSLGPDGRIYWCAGRFPHEIRRPGGLLIRRGTAPVVLRCLPDGSELEVVCGSQGNAVGVTFSPAGDMFASGTFLAPDSMGAGLRDALVHCVDGAEYPVRGRDLDEHKRTGELLPPLAHLGVSASSDLMFCRSDGLSSDFRGDLFSALFNMHKIMRHRIEPAGATYACRNEDFLVSSDPDFHPTDVFEDADGTMLVIDTGGWFRIGCPTSQVAKPDVLGGIYRVRRKDAPQLDDPRGLKIDWEALSAEQLCELLADRRFAVSDRAIAELASRGRAAVGALENLRNSGTDVETKCAAVWALTRVNGEVARAAVRRALEDPEADVRQAAARSGGLHRDDAALEPLCRLVRSDAPAVRREAATSLGRIGEARAVPALLDALKSAGGDRFLEHALIFALIQIDDPAHTRAGLEATEVHLKRGALIALDQMDHGHLKPEMVTPYLNPADPLLRETALWVIAHHPEWADAMLGFFRQWLARDEMDDAKRTALRQQLLAFAGDDDVQELIAAALDDSKTPTTTRLLLLEVIAQAPLAKLPGVWAAALERAVAEPDERIVRQTVATLRALPLDKRPILSRVEKQINYPETDGRFAGTKLSDNFCVRFRGVLRCPHDGSYKFYTDSDDGSWLYVDGKLVVDNGGSHAMREREGTIELPAGDHELRLDFVEQTGDAGCVLSWVFEGRAKEVVPPEALFHRRQDGRGADSDLKPGLWAEYYTPAAAGEAFPDLAASRFDEPLLLVAMDTARPRELRVQAAAAVTHRLAALEPDLFEFLRAGLNPANPPLLRLDAAEALGKAHLERRQLSRLCESLSECGALETPKLVRAFEQSGDEQIGRQLVAALARSPGLMSLQGDALSATLAFYPDTVRARAKSLFARLSRDVEKQQAKLASLADVTSGGEIQRGRDLFFGNKKAICATCHAVHGQGGTVGPDLSKIGAIRTPRDLLEAIVLPSASFARGYEAFTLATRDGQVHSGVIVRETAEAVHLFGTNRVEVRVPREAIEDLKQSTVSIMPEGMDEQLSREELADLIAFLQSLR